MTSTSPVQATHSSLQPDAPPRGKTSGWVQGLLIQRRLRKALPLILLCLGMVWSAGAARNRPQKEEAPQPSPTPTFTPSPTQMPAGRAEHEPAVEATPVPVEPTLSPRGERIWWAGTAGPLDPRTRTRHLNLLSAAPKVKAAVPGAVQQYTANFQDDLFMQTDLVLPGIESVQTITFTRPRSWRVLPGSELRIQLEHSSALIAEQSHLTISLNDVALKTVRLDASNIIGGEIHIPIPESMLQDYNRLKFEVQQHYTFECEDPFDRSLWTKVSRFSEIYFQFQEKVIEPDLAKYPLPLVDRTGYGHTILRYLLPTRPSSQSIEALGLVAAGLGRDVAYGRLAMESPIRTLSEATGHTILVGTAQENPEIARLASGKLAGLGADQGFLALMPHPSNPLITLLIVSGGGPEGVLKAARTLSTPHRRFVLSGPTAVVSQLEPEQPSEAYARPGFVPSSGNFTLKDIGFTDLTARGYFASPIRVEVRTFPDQKFLERLQSFRLIYSYGAQLDNRLSTLEVRWNNITVQSVGLTRPEGETRAEVNVDLPVEIMTAYNTLQIIFHLLPRSYNPCETKHDHPLWGTIFSDSSFEFHRYRHVELPDLGKLQFGLYPYGIHQDLKDTLLVLPDAPESNDLASGLTVAAELGRATIAQGLALRMIQSADVSPQLRAENHMILINTGRPSTLLESIAPDRVVTALQDSKTLTGSQGVLLHSKDINTLAFVEQVLSPFASGRVITILQGLNQDTLQRALSMLLDIRLMSQLTGDVSVMDKDGQIEGNAIRPQESFGTIPVLVSARAFGRKHPWAIVSGLLAALFVVYMLLKSMLELYRRRHHAHVLTEPPPGEEDEEEEEDDLPESAPLVESDGPEHHEGQDAARAQPAAVPGTAPSTAPTAQDPTRSAPDASAGQGNTASPGDPIPAAPSVVRPARRLIPQSDEDDSASSMTRRRPRPGRPPHSGDAG